MAEALDPDALPSGSAAPAQLVVTEVTPGRQLSSRLPSQIEQTQRQVDEVVQVMRKNLESIEARERNLNELERRAETLEVQAREFHVQGTRLQRKMWWKDMKWTLIGIGAATTVLVIIIIILVTTLSK